ncbi:MAG: hypothetical protein LBK22_00335 [Tannerella sp.]|nr:hypothetical protein [Tannerella sp.]
MNRYIEKKLYWMLHAPQARRQMVEARETHRDSLVYRMQDAAVKPVIETIISSEMNMSLNLDSPGIQQAMDLELVTFDTNKGLTVSNPIYTEILTRVVSSSMQIRPPQQTEESPLERTYHVE